MFERFTERARQATILARESARNRFDDSIDPIDLLVGLVSEQGLAAQVLADFRVSVESLASAVKGSTHLEGADLPHYGQSWSPTTKKILEASLREALSLGHNYISTEHLLLSLCRVAPEVLPTDPAAIRDALVRKLRERDEPKKPEPYYEIEISPSQGLTALQGALYYVKGDETESLARVVGHSDTEIEAELIARAKLHKRGTTTKRLEI